MKTKTVSRKFEIYGKTRIIRDVRFDEPDNFEAYYKGYYIHVQLEEDTHWIYAWCNAPDGTYIVDGYIERSLYKRTGIDDGIRECLENIFHGESDV